MANVSWSVDASRVTGFGLTLPGLIARCAGEVRSAIWIRPLPVGQPVGADRAVGLEPQHRQHRALLGAAECDRMVVDACFQVSEDADLHALGQPNHLA